MRKRFAIALSALAVAGVVGLADSASAACVRKAGEGSGSSPDSAKFQAWEAVLQATDWGSWGGFMGGGMRIGSAPGYRVSNVGSSCRKGGSLGYVCRMSATLCN